MANADFLFQFIAEIERIVQPLEESLNDPTKFEALLKKYGWVVDPASLDLEQIGSVIGVVADLKAVQMTLTDLFSNLPTPDTLVALQKSIQGLFHKLYNLTNQAAPPGLSNLWSTFGAELPDGLIADYLEKYHVPIFAFVRVSGIIEERLIDVHGAAKRQNYTRRQIRWERLPDVLNPSNLFQRDDSYSWGSANISFNFNLLFNTLSSILPLLGLPTSVEIPSSSLLDPYYSSNSTYRNQVNALKITLMDGENDGNSVAIRIMVMPIPPGVAFPSNASPEGLLFTPLIEVTGTQPNQAWWPYSLELGGQFQFNEGLRLLVWPPANFRIDLVSAGSFEGSFALFEIGQYPKILFGSRLSHHLRFFGWKIGLYASGQVISPNVSASFSVDRLQLIIDLGEGDSFLHKIFGSEEQTIEFSGSLVWDKDGLHFEGAGGLELIIPINRSIALVEIFSLNFDIRISQNGIHLIPTVSGKAEIGPISASVSKLGAALHLRPTSAGDGLLGKLDVDFGFKRPDGIGIRINAGPVTGGGFLEIDEPNGRYSGILQLSVGAIGITVIGLLDTKLPGGVSGYSFLLVVAVKFLPIQLGFGFALTGLGGLAGIHRSMVQQALQDGVRNQSLDHILFPDDPVKNAPRLINDLRTIFPPTQNVYVFGPVAQLIWGGVTTIIEAELGVILQLPDPLVIVILGQFNVMLPNKDVEVKIVELHLDIIGIIDITNKHLSLDASLHHSRIGIFSVEGDMAMRLSWGSPPNFLLSVGGFNSHFQPPPNTPQLRRITFALATGDNPRLRLMAYFAITSNSVQFGARAELYASALGFTLNGWLGFEALFYFKPRFAFIIDLDAGVEIKRGNWVIAAIKLFCSLSGPSPYHIKGEAVFHVIFEIRIPFDKTFGDQTQDEDEAVKRIDDLWLELKRELEDPRNWVAVVPPNTHPGVSIEVRDTNERARIFDPLGGIIVRQRLLPLNRRITRFGEVALETPARFEIDNFGDKVTDFFAPSQFDILSDQEKLSRPSFDKMEAGVTLSANNTVQFGRTQGATFDYESWEIDAEPDEVPIPSLSFISLAERLDGRQVGVGLVAFLSDNAQPLVRLEDEKYIVVDAPYIIYTRDEAFEKAKEDALTMNHTPQPVIPLTDWEG
jgi:hypothetical protein